MRTCAIIHPLHLELETAQSKLFMKVRREGVQTRSEAGTQRRKAPRHTLAVCRRVERRDCPSQSRIRAYCRSCMNNTGHLMVLREARSMRDASIPSRSFRFRPQITGHRLRPHNRPSRRSVRPVPCHPCRRPAASWIPCFLHVPSSLAHARRRSCAHTG
jgi:hypothetical protein